MGTTCVPMPEKARRENCIPVLELQTVCVAVWVLGLKLGSTGRASSSLSHGAISPVYFSVFFISVLLSVRALERKELGKDGKFFKM